MPEHPSANLRHALAQIEQGRSRQAERRPPVPDPDAQAQQPAQAAQQAQRQHATRAWATRLWQQAQPPDPQHPYLQRCGIHADGARQLRDLLLLPLRIQRQLVNLQLIRPSGHCRFLSASALDGAALVLGPLRAQPSLLLSVGWASACSLRQASGLTVIVAFNAANLVRVAERLVVSLPSRVRVLVCGDLTPGGVGQRAAARAVLRLRGRGMMTFPPIQAQLQERNPMQHPQPPIQDFNQLQQHAGADAVRAALHSALPDSGAPHGNHENSEKPATKTCPQAAPSADTAFPLPPSANGNHEKPAPDAPASDSQPAPGFLLRHDGPRPGVLWLNGDHAPLWICAPLTVAAKTRDAHGGHWGRWLHWHDAEQRLHQWAMPAELTCGDGSELARALARGGLDIQPTRRARELLSAYILHSRCSQLARCTDRSGWHGQAFVLPDQVIGAAAGETLLLQNDGDPLQAPACGGSLQQWQQQLAQPAQAHRRLCFVLSLAFAAPLAALTDETGGFHLLGGSSIGKTSALDLAASVWGHPADWRRSWRATSNGLEGLCARHNDLLLILDELSQLDPTHASTAAYLIANGQGKARAHCTGQLHPPSRWRVLLLSAGELQLDQLLQSQGQRRRAGQEIRLLDLAADAGHGCGILDQPPTHGSAADLIQQLSQASQQHYGHAGRAFLQRLCTQREAISQQLKTERRAFVATQLPADAAGQTTRAAQRFALVASAGELASQWGLTGWPVGTANQAVSQLFNEWLSSRGDAHDRETHDGLAAIKSFLEIHGDSRFSPWLHANDSRTANRVGFRRDMADGPYFYVLPQAFRSELCQGHDSARLTRALAANGWLKIQSPDRYTVKTRLPGMGETLVNVYVLTPALWR